MPAFDTPVHLNHLFLRHILKAGDRVLDATCGNGQDTLFLAELVLKEDQGWVYGLDIQKEAIEKTKAHLKEHLKPKLLSRITLKEACHSDLSDFEKRSLDLIVYNFGYLPGSDHQKTTKSSSSLQSLFSALELIKPLGYLSLVCYPGHEEGKKEADQILNWAKELPKEYTCSKHLWINRSSQAPFLLMIQRKLKLPSKIRKESSTS